MVYAFPGCSYCSDAKAEFSSLAEDADISPRLWTLAACDTDAATDVVDHLLVTSLPTFMYVQNGNPLLDYDGERKQNALKSFLLQMTEDISK